MRWKKITKPKIKTGDTRLRRFFAWWPVTIDGESRWLEEVVVEYVWRVDMVVSQSGCYDDPGWKAVRFADELAAKKGV